MVTETEYDEEGYEILDVVISQDERKDLSQENWDRNMKLRDVNFKVKGYHKAPLINLTKVLIVLSLFVLSMFLIGVMYFVIVIALTMVFLMLFQVAYHKILNGERIFSFREKSKKNKKLRQRIIEGIDSLMKKQI